MSEREDPIASTQMFRAFVQGGEPEPPAVTRRVSPAAIAITLVLVAAAIALTVWLVIR